MLERKTPLVPISVIKAIDANSIFAQGDKVILADTRIDNPCPTHYRVCRD